MYYNQEPIFIEAARRIRRLRGYYQRRAA